MTDAVDAHLDRAAAGVRRHLGNPARAEALGLRLSRVEELTGLSYQHYTPSLAMVLSGRKRSIVGEHDQRWGREHFLITPVDLPVSAGVVELDTRGEFLSAIWRLDPAIVSEVAGSMARTAGPTPDEPPRLGTWTPQLADAVARFLGLLDAPEDIPVLAPLLTREVVLRLLQTEQAPRMLAAVGTPRSGIVVRAIEALNDSIDKPWSLARLSTAVGASPSTLARRFKQVTGMTPLHYLKRLRLGEAQRRMVVLGESAGQAAGAVGYLSASHFSRDYRAAYDATPAADAARVRARLRSVAAAGYRGDVPAIREAAEQE
ncbi:AraC family transcriptional regulator [Myceligenerans sp. TRM 65318]|uniref:AraC family transcriptional regulator n=1 Tax=Myceligenerans pegani TaxID=2776917 RepID=A0ABR9N4U1_9MICO|nr:AraC family transcriptional regulator [Myceligenerans sp. TRM 65318]MBE3020467.1 AraC family transcriptional regulator [Myceligenerans sp. TRM 65318]